MSTDWIGSMDVSPLMVELYLMPSVTSLDTMGHLKGEGLQSLLLYLSSCVFRCQGHVFELSENGSGNQSDWWGVTSKADSRFGKGNVN